MREWIARNNDTFCIIFNKVWVIISPNFSYSMAVLVRLSRHVMSANDTGSFLSMTYGSALVHVKRNYDKLMRAHLKSIQDVRIAKKSKCGILPFVANFEVRRTSN